MSGPISIDDVAAESLQVRELLKDSLFSQLHGRLGGVTLYDAYIRTAQEQVDTVKSPEIRDAYQRGVQIATALRVFEEQREPLTHPSDADSIMRWDQGGAGCIVFGDGSYIELSPVGENRYRPADHG